MDRNGMAGSCVALLCGAMMPCPGHAQLSVPDAFSRMRGHQITGATVITHGFQPLDTLGNSLMPLAQAIRDELSDQSGDNVWLLDYELNDAGATGFYNTANSVLPAAGAALQSGHVVLLWDWAPESHDTNGRWADSVGDTLFSHLVGMRIANPRNPAASPPIHMIGHSFGTGVTSEAVERLATWQVPVANLTYLDPHDFDQADIEVDEDQQIFSLGRPPGYGATVWNNVEFADVYYQTRGQQGAGVQLFTADPEGRPIPGAANHLLVDELPSTASGNPYGLTHRITATSGQPFIRRPSRAHSPRSFRNQQVMSMLVKRVGLTRRTTRIRFRNQLHSSLRSGLQEFWNTTTRTRIL